eukprot:COSAG06_NODE_30725_length_533_cov_1.308756_1_plen_114_part_10
METFAPPDLFGAGPNKRRGRVKTRKGEPRPQTAPSNKRGATDDLEDEAEKGARVSAKRSPSKLDEERSSRRQAVGDAGEVDMSDDELDADVLDLSSLDEEMPDADVDRALQARV